jgi:hypothetical protein
MRPWWCDGKKGNREQQNLKDETYVAGVNRFLFMVVVGREEE